MNNEMYYVPGAYPNPYYANVDTSVYYPEYLTRNQQEHDPQTVEAVLEGIKREALAIDLYNRLANVAPNQQHQDGIVHVLERKKAHLTQLTNLYVNLTGNQPVYETDSVDFHSYRDGLKKAYKAGVVGYEEYHKDCLLMQHPQVRNVFLWALTGERENAARLGYLNDEFSKRVTDYGKEPFVVDINEAAKQNNTFRTAIWTGNHLQVTLMSIGVGEDIGLEIHPKIDQFLRVEQGQGVVQMGKRKDHLDFQKEVYDDFAIMIPAGTWHNVTNTGNEPLKLYSIYAPPQHPFGTVHETKAEAMAAEE